MKAKKLLFALLTCLLFFLTGCLKQEVSGEVKEYNSSLPKFSFEKSGFPPYPNGFIKVDDTLYEMEMGGFRWNDGNRSVITDAASPTQIAEHFEAIVLEPNSLVTIQIEQNPDLTAFLWDTFETNVVLDENELTVPHNKGWYIY